MKTLTPEEEHLRRLLKKRAAMLPRCTVPGCNQTTNGVLSICGTHRKEFEERREADEAADAARNAKADVVGWLRHAETLDDVRGALSALADWLEAS